MSTLNQSKAVVLFSGGLDSTVLLYWARQRYNEVLAVTVDYGQSNLKEVEAAAKIAKIAGIEHILVKIPMFGDSMLISGENGLKDPKSGTTAPKELVFVPGRNLVFLAYLAQIAHIRGFGTILAGFDGDKPNYEGYPDTRFGPMKAFGEAINLGFYGEPGKLRFLYPFVALDKHEILVEALLLPGCWDAIELSYTCHLPDGPCGLCGACEGRREGFFRLGEPDPALVSKPERPEKPPVKKGWVSAHST